MSPDGNPGDRRPGLRAYHCPSARDVPAFASLESRPSRDGSPAFAVYG